MTFTFTTLGSSSALPTSKRFTSAHVLNVRERFLLIDCGEGAQMQLRKYKFKLGKIDNIFISHIHGDHVFGLFGLISSFNLIGREKDLKIFGPPELEQVISNILNDFYIYPCFRIVFNSVDCEKSVKIYEDDILSVNTIPLKHRIPTCGYLVKEKKKQPNLRKEMIEKYDIPISKRQGIKEGNSFKLDNGEVIPCRKLVKPAPEPRTFAYCSDTSFNEGIITQIKNVDLLYHEATFGDDHQEMAKENMHSTAREAATIARKASAKKLVIGHFSARYKNILTLQNEAKQVFENTHIAEDGKTFNV